MKHLTKKERKKITKEKKQAMKNQKKALASVENKHYLRTLFWLIIVPSFLLGLFGWIIVQNNKTKSTKPVHWHMPISYEFCGKPFTPVEKKEHGLVHGHDDGLAHVEGKITDDKSITLGVFMDTIGMPFDADKIGEFTNGDTCPNSDTPGQVQVFIDGKLNTEFRDHVFNNKEKIKIIFK